MDKRRNTTSVSSNTSVLQNAEDLGQVMFVLAEKTDTSFSVFLSLIV
jgi:hypothetical protein